MRQFVWYDIPGMVAVHSTLPGCMCAQLQLHSGHDPPQLMITRWLNRQVFAEKL